VSPQRITLFAYFHFAVVALFTSRLSRKDVSINKIFQIDVVETHVSAEQVDLI